MGEVKFYNPVPAISTVSFVRLVVNCRHKKELVLFFEWLMLDVAVFGVFSWFPGNTSLLWRFCQNSRSYSRWFHQPKFSVYLSIINLLW